jgi:hypothetical protein
MTQYQTIRYKPALGCFGSTGCIKQNSPLRCMRVNKLLTPTLEIHLRKITLGNPVPLKAA